MKIGEVAVLSQETQNRDDFIKSICNKIELKNESISFGRFEVNEQLALHLYGINLINNDKELSWDLISRKMLGYIIIFNWEEPIARDKIISVIDQFVINLQAPTVIIANIKDINQAPIPKIFFQPDGITLSSNFRFTFGQADTSGITKRIMIMLIDMMLEKIS